MTELWCPRDKRVRLENLLEVDETRKHDSSTLELYHTREMLAKSRIVGRADRLHFEQRCELPDSIH